MVDTIMDTKHKLNYLLTHMTTKNVAYISKQIDIIMQNYFNSSHYSFNYSNLKFNYKHHFNYNFKKQLMKYSHADTNKQSAIIKEYAPFVKDGSFSTLGALSLFKRTALIQSFKITKYQALKQNTKLIKYLLNHLVQLSYK